MGALVEELFYATYVINFDPSAPPPDMTEPARRVLKWMASEEREVTGATRYVGLTFGVIWLPAADLIKMIFDQLSAARRGEPMNAPFQTDLSADEITRLATVEPRIAVYSVGGADALRGALDPLGTYPWIDERGRPIERRYGAGLGTSI